MMYANRCILVRVIYLAVAATCWLIMRCVRARHSRRSVLCYHGVTHHQATRFERQARYLAQRPHLNAQLTFDDAFVNVFVNALPTLDALRMPATIFAVTSAPGSPPPWLAGTDHPDAQQRTMTIEELQAIARGCMHSIGSHTAHHPRLTDCADDELRRELRDSKEALESWLGNSVDELALPHGAADVRIVRACRDAGYRRVYTLDPARDGGDEQLQVIGRMSMSPDAWWIEFVLTVHGAYAWLPWLRRIVRAIGSAIARQLRPAAPTAGSMSSPFPGILFSEKRN